MLMPAERKLITKLDRRAKQLFKTANGNHEAVLAGMADEMPKVKKLIYHTGQQALDMSMAQHPYFHRFMKLLEGLAKGIASGDIAVPKR